MRRSASRWVGVFAALSFAASAVAASPVAAPARVLRFERFGAVTVYPSIGAAREFVMFVSGDGGWNLGVVSMARALTHQHAIVVGIDVRHYLEALRGERARCVSPAVDFENLSHYVQAKLGLPRYLQPTLVGYSSGATLVYATLVESPEGLFKGALSIGFCPDLDLTKPVCAGSGIHAAPRRDRRGVLRGVNFLPAKTLSGRWISLQGEIDQVCPIAPTQRFIAQVPGAEMVRLPKVGHGYGVERNWMPQFKAAFARLTVSAPPAARVTTPSSGAAPATAVPRAPKKAPPVARASAAVAFHGPIPPVDDLPLAVIPAAPGTHSRWFGVFLSGDGGWVGIDRQISHALAARGIPMVGWDSLRYFWTPRTPEGSAQDLDRVLRHFALRWGKSRVLLVGYSQGADTLPFMINRLPPTTHAIVGLTALLGISDSAQFEFHVANWLGSTRGGIPTAPELARWTGSHYLCLYGRSDREATCAHSQSPWAISVEMPGGHHFDGHYAAIADRILAHLPSD